MGLSRLLFGSLIRCIVLEELDAQYTPKEPLIGFTASPEDEDYPYEEYDE